MIASQRLSCSPIALCPLVLYGSPLERSKLPWLKSGVSKFEGFEMIDCSPGAIEKGLSFLTDGTLLRFGCPRASYALVSVSGSLAKNQLLVGSRIFSPKSEYLMETTSASRVIGSPAGSSAASSARGSLGLDAQLNLSFVPAQAPFSAASTPGR